VNEPVQPVASTAHLYNVYLMTDPDTKGQWVGGSYDNISAVTIACSWYSTTQQLVPANNRLIAVFDDTDTVIAAIGAEAQ